MKACQLDGTLLRAVIEVPALGFAWIPKEGPPGIRPMNPRLQMSDPRGKTIRNEFFEAEVDPVTGGLKAIRDHKTRVNRLGQRLVFNPSSRMVARDIRVDLERSGTGGNRLRRGVAGRAESDIGDLQATAARVAGQTAAGDAHRASARAAGGRLSVARLFRQPLCLARRACRAHARLWGHQLSHHSHAPANAGLSGVAARTARDRSAHGRLPFHQRHEGRMLDVILQPEGEDATTFDLGIALDRDMPMQTALGYTSPVALVPTTKGPPHVGSSGWLFHLDAPNLLLTRLMPGPLRKGLGAALSRRAHGTPLRMCRPVGHRRVPLCSQSQTGGYPRCARPVPVTGLAQRRRRATGSDAKRPDAFASRIQLTSNSLTRF